MMNTGQKFMNEVSPSHQVYAGTQGGVGVV